MTKLGKISVGSIYCCQEFNQVDSSRISVSIDIIPIFASVRRFFKSDLIISASSDGSLYIDNFIKLG